MVNNDLTLNARVSDLEKQVAELKGQVAQSNRLTIWQFISFTFVMAGTLFGTLAWISGSLREELRTNREMLEKRLELSDKHIGESFGQMEKRFEQMEKRFEDLRQVLLSQQKQSPQR